MRIGVGISAGVVMALAVASGGPARACYNAISEAMEPDEARRQIRWAEHDLANGRYKQGLSSMLQGEVWCAPCKDPWAVKRDRTKTLNTRLRRLYATALLYSGYRRQALSLLQRLSAELPEDPYVRSRLAEAMALSPSDEAAGRRALETLAAQDLLIDATSYATLAHVRGRAGDEAGRQAALVTCRQRAKLQSVCERPPAPKQKYGPPEPDLDTEHQRLKGDDDIL